MCKTAQQATGTSLGKQQAEIFSIQRGDRTAAGQQGQ
jgi:hypothetical protein